MTDLVKGMFYQCFHFDRSSNRSRDRPNLTNRQACNPLLLVSKNYHHQLYHLDFIGFYQDFPKTETLAAIWEH